MKWASKLQEKCLNHDEITCRNSAITNIPGRFDQVESHSRIENQVLANVELSQSPLNLICCSLHLIDDFPVPLVLKFFSIKCLYGLIILNRFRLEEFLIFFVILFITDNWDTFGVFILGVFYILRVVRHTVRYGTK